MIVVSSIYDCGSLQLLTMTNTPSAIAASLKLPWGQAWATTDLGKARHNNEDRYLLQAWPDHEAILIVVADGMGGSSAGEIAAQIAVDTFAELLNAPLPSEPRHQYEALLTQCYEADQRIRERAVTSFQTLGMGTTIVAAIITPATCIHLYAGDSRLYHFREGQLLHRTADHSIIQLLLEMGKIQPEDIPRHPMRAIVNSCLGGKNGQEDFSVDPKWQEENPPIIHLRPNDLILLCSDGLNNALLSPTLESLVKEGYANRELLNQDLLENALEGKASDNISFVTLAIAPL
jgi:protein phosphatase